MDAKTRDEEIQGNVSQSSKPSASAVAENTEKNNYLDTVSGGKGAVKSEVKHAILKKLFGIGGD